MTKQQARLLGGYIRARRGARRLTTEAVAAHAGVDAAQIRRLERGEVQAPQARVLGKVADILKVPVNDLLVLADYPTSRTLPSIEPYLHAKYPKLDSTSVDALKRHLHDLLEGEISDLNSE